jgi:hypothetical protein
MELVQPLSVREEHRVVIGATPTRTSVRLAVVEIGAQLHLANLHLPQLHLLAGFVTGAKMELVQPLSVREEHRVVIGATPTRTSVRLAVVESGVLPQLVHLHLPHLHLPHLHLPQLHLLAGFATGAQMELVQPLSVREEHRAVIGATPTRTSVRLDVVESGVLPHLSQLHLPQLAIMVTMDAVLVGKQLVLRPTPPTHHAVKIALTTTQMLTLQNATCTAHAATPDSLPTLVVSHLTLSRATILLRSSALMEITRHTATSRSESQPLE